MHFADFEVVSKPQVYICNYKIMFNFNASLIAGRSGKRALAWLATLALAVSLVGPVPALAAGVIGTYSDGTCTIATSSFETGSVVYVGGTDYTEATGDILAWTVEPAGDAGTGGPVEADGTFCIPTLTVGAEEVGITQTVTVRQELGADLFNSDETTFEVVAPPAAGTRYVANGGDDSGDCLVAADPCATIQYAIDQALD